MTRFLLLVCLSVSSILFSEFASARQQISKQQRTKLLQRFPAADTNNDGTLSDAEIAAARAQMRGERKRQSGVKRNFKVDPGWDRPRFPDNAMCYQSPEQIRAIFEQVNQKQQPAIVSFAPPQDGALRTVGVGHSFMAPGYRTLPLISRAAGMSQPLYTHVGGGMTGSARYKWEQENGIFEFAGKPYPKLLASIANAEWDAMLFGPYFNDRPAYYSCWIDFCLKYNPKMKFYISDAWPQLMLQQPRPNSEAAFTEDTLDTIGKQKRKAFAQTFDPLAKAYPGRIFVLPTSDAMVLAARSFVRGELPQIDGLHRLIGGQERSLWKDQIGHLGPGLDRLEGYVFFATLYGRSPETIEQPIPFKEDKSFPGPQLDQIFRRIAWQAVTNHPKSGVKDADGDGFKDSPTK